MILALYHDNGVMTISSWCPTGSSNSIGLEVKLRNPVAKPEPFAFKNLLSDLGHPHPLHPLHPLPPLLGVFYQTYFPQPHRSESSSLPLRAAKVVSFRAEVLPKATPGCQEGLSPVCCCKCWCTCDSVTEWSHPFSCCGQRSIECLHSGWLPEGCHPLQTNDHPWRCRRHRSISGPCCRDMSWKESSKFLGRGDPTERLDPVSPMEIVWAEACHHLPWRL